MNFLKVLVLAALLAGCSQETQDGIKYAIAEYKDVESKDYAINGETWRIFDRADAAKIMIIAPFNRINRESFRDGMSLGLGKKTLNTDAEFRPAATAYIASIGCKIGEGRLVVRTQYEFDYTC